MPIATLIAAGRLDDRLLASAIERLPGARAGAWIEPTSAIDLELPDLAGTRDALIGWEGVDLIPIPKSRAIGLFVADMDSTMIGQECIDELADYAGFKEQVAAITERAMQGELDFASALAERVKLLEGLEESVIAQCLAERVRPNRGAERLIKTLRQEGIRTLLVSGGFTAFAGPVGAMLGFDRVVANVLAVEDGKLTGRTTGSIVDAAMKQAMLIEERLALSGAGAMAIGDGANDRRMVEEAELGVAYRAKPALAEAADARLDHHPLDALLWALGIPSARWAEV